MPNAQPEGLLWLAIIMAAALGVLVYVFLRIAGVVGRHGRGDGRPPPPTPMG